jgi:hypothetical protein
LRFGLAYLSCAHSRSDQPYGEELLLSYDTEQRRRLTSGELEVLRHIQDLYGLQNTEADVAVNDSGEAIIFIKDRFGNLVMFAVLTNLAQWCAEGLIKSSDDLRDNWLSR